MTTREVSYNLAGCVRNQSLPVSGTTIILYDYWSTGKGLVRHYVGEVTTGPKGDFSFDVRRGIYSLEVVPNRDTRFSRQSIETIKVTSNTTLTVHLKTGSEFSGTVKTTSGQLVKNCELLFFGIEPEAVRASETADESGKFSIALPKGKYYVACKHRGGGDKSVSFLCPTLGVVELNRDLRGENMILPELVSFKGVVSNPDGHPVSGVKVTVRQSHPDDNPHSREADLSGVCYTNKSGQFECNVEPGLYDVKLEPGADSHLSERIVSAILVDQARSRTYSLGSGYRLSGRVTFNDEPVQNALVSVFGGKTDSSVLTDDDGLYSFALSGGSYEMIVTAQPDSLAKLPYRLLAPHTCALKLAEDTENNISLTQGVAISGKVVDDAEHPRPGVQLALYSDTGGGIDTTSGAQRPLMFGITGDDGSYEFRVSAGRYWLVINNQQSTACAIEASDEDLQSDLTWHSGCLVEFELVSEFDEVVPHVQVFCEPYNAAGTKPSAEPIQAVSDENGICRLSVPAGVYSFRFEPPEHGSFQARQIRQFSINTDVRRKVKLNPKAVTAQPASP